MEREVGGGIGMGKTCKLKDVSFQCMTKKKKKRKNVIRDNMLDSGEEEKHRPVNHRVTSERPAQR